MSSERERTNPDWSRDMPVLPGHEPATLHGLGPRARARPGLIRTLQAEPYSAVVVLSHNALRSHPESSAAPPPSIELMTASASGGYAPVSSASPAPSGSGLPVAAPDRAERFAEARTHVFREVAMLAHERGERMTTALRASPPGSWILVACLTSLIGGSIVAASLCSISVVGRGPGVLQPASGTRVVAAAVSGRVAVVHVGPGTPVRTGDLLLTLDSSELQSRRLQAEQRMDTAERQLQRLQSTDAALFRESVGEMQAQVRLLVQRIRSLQQSEASLQQQKAAIDELKGEGFVSSSTARELGERIRDAERTRLHSEQQLSEARLSLVSATREHTALLERARVERDAAASEQESTRLLIDRSLVTAPSDGQVESIVAKPGELLQAGSVVARLIPQELPSLVVAYIPDRDRGFLEIGSEVWLEAAQLPSNEFGTMRGRVSRIANGFAGPEEIRAVLGAQAQLPDASFRLEIALEQDARTRRLLSTLRSGTSLTARVALRERRIITLLFDPLRRYLE